MIDALIPLAFIAYTVFAGLRARRRAGADADQFFLAGRTLRGWQAGASMAATQFAADTPLVVTGLVATAGLFGLWQLSSYGLAFLLLGFLFAPLWRRARVLTDAELAEIRYSGRGAVALRLLRAVLFGVVFNVVVVAMVLLATTMFAEHFLDWEAWLPGGAFAPVVALVEAVGVPLTLQPDAPDAWARSASNLISILAMTAVALGYSTLGGLRGIVATDVVQLAIMLTATALYAGFALAAIGGTGGLMDALAEAERAGRLGGQRVDQLLALAPSGARDVGAGLVAVFSLQWLLQRNADGTGYLAQRAMACRSDGDARQAALWFAGIQVLLRTLLWVPLALALLVLLPPAAGLEGSAFTRDREASFVAGMATLLPAGALGLLLTGMLAALMSTIDTHLNWGASYVARDLYARGYCQGLRGRSASPRAEVWVARVAGASLLVLALFVMTQLDSIQSAWKATLVLGAGLGVVTVLRWLWWRITAWGELAAMATAFAGTPAVRALVPGEAAQMLGMAAAATTVAVAVSLLGPRTDTDVLRRFVERVRPPGFWGPYGTTGDGARLAQALVATAAAAVTLFGLLIAGLRLLVPLPGASFATIAVALACAAAAAPVWLAELRRGTSGPGPGPEPE